MIALIYGIFIQGNQLNICDGPDLICCNRMLEKNLSQLSVKQYRRAFLSRNLLPIKTNLINYAYNFDSMTYLNINFYY